MLQFLIIHLNQANQFCYHVYKYKGEVTLVWSEVISLNGLRLFLFHLRTDVQLLSIHIIKQINDGELLWLLRQKLLIGVISNVYQHKYHIACFYWNGMVFISLIKCCCFNKISFAELLMYRLSLFKFILRVKILMFSIGLLKSFFCYRYHIFVACRDDFRMF